MWIASSACCVLLSVRLDACELLPAWWGGLGDEGRGVAVGVQLQVAGLAGVPGLGVEGAPAGQSGEGLPAALTRVGAGGLEEVEEGHLTLPVRHTRRVDAHIPLARLGRRRHRLSPPAVVTDLLVEGEPQPQRGVRWPLPASQARLAPQAQPTPPRRVGRRRRRAAFRGDEAVDDRRGDGRHQLMARAVGVRRVRRIRHPIHAYHPQPHIRRVVHHPIHVHLPRRRPHQSVEVVHRAGDGGRLAHLVEEGGDDCGVPQRLRPLQRLAHEAPRLRRGAEAPVQVVGADEHVVHVDPTLRAVQAPHRRRGRRGVRHVADGGGRGGAVDGDAGDVGGLGQQRLQPVQHGVAEHGARSLSDGVAVCHQVDGGEGGGAGEEGG